MLQRAWLGLRFKTSGGMREASTFVSSLVEGSPAQSAIPLVPSRFQHCTGWQSASRVHIQCDSVLHLEYHHSWGHSGYLGVQRPLLVPPQTCLCQGKVRVRLGPKHHYKRELTLSVALPGVWLPPSIIICSLGSRLSLPVPDDVDGFDPPGSRELDHTLSHATVGSILNDTVPYK